jgi:hypothetical protein
MDDKARQFAREIQQTPTGRVLSENIEALKRLAQSPQTKEALMALGERGKEAAQRAAESIKRGNVAGLTELLTLLSQTEEGRNILNTLKNITGR